VHRCFVSPNAWRNDRLVLDDEESRHLDTVLRAGIGTAVHVFDGEGREADAEVTTLGRQTTLRILTDHRLRSRPKPDVVLVQAIPKGTHMDEIVEKATELGVAEIRPAVTEHVVRRPGQDRAPRQVARWHRIAISAAKQCGTPWIPAIHSPTPLAAALAAEQSKIELFLVGSLETDARPAREVLRAANAPNRVALLVGPEGDLSPAEYRLARDAGAIPVSFGCLVLRVETAALYGLSVINYELRAATH